MLENMLVKTTDILAFFCSHFCFSQLKKKETPIFLFDTNYLILFIQRIKKFDIIQLKEHAGHSGFVSLHFYFVA